MRVSYVLGPDYEPGGTMISGGKVARPKKEDLANDIADFLGLPRVVMSNGATVVSTFLDDISTALTGLPTGGADTYRKAEAVLGLLGLAYDPYWDTSESTPTGGGTVTARAYSRIRAGLTGTPRCFVLNSTDAPAGARWETDPRSLYRYDSTVTGRRPLNEAGPGSQVLIYSTSKSSTNKMCFVACAEIKYIGPGWDGPWEAQLTDFSEFGTPVPVSEVEIIGWNRQHAITEIDWETFAQIVDRGGVPKAGVFRDRAVDPTIEVVESRVQADFPAVNTSIRLAVPSVLPDGVLRLGEPETPAYSLADDGSTVDGGSGLRSRSNVERASDRVAEKRAVELATQALEADGWSLLADRQAHGVGYDLDFSQGGRVLHVEVKGVQGSRLVFNLTPKERWRAATDPEWVVVAVTSVLSPTSPRLHLVTRDRIAAATTVVSGYRVRL